MAIELPEPPMVPLARVIAPLPLARMFSLAVPVTVEVIFPFTVTAPELVVPIPRSLFNVSGMGLPAVPIVNVPAAVVPMAASVWLPKMLFTLMPVLSRMKPPVAVPSVNAQLPVLVLAIWPMAIVVPDATFTAVESAVAAVL